MYIAAIRALLKLTERGTLKDKRTVVRGFTARMERELRLSCTETGRWDSTAFVEVGLCKAAADYTACQRAVEEISGRIYEDPRFCYVELDHEIIPMG